MGSEYFPVGTTGHLYLVDNTDNPDLMTVDIQLRSDPPISVPSLPWAYRIDGSEPTWRSYDFAPLFTTQTIASIYVGRLASEFTFLLGNTGTEELDGPAEFTISVNRNEGLNDSVLIRVEGTYRRATPYIRTNGVWVVAEPYVKTPMGWARVE